MEDLSQRFPGSIYFGQNQELTLNPQKNFLGVVVHEKDEEGCWEELKVMMAGIRRRLSLEYLVVRPNEIELLAQLCYLGVKNIIVMLTPRSVEHQLELYEMMKRVQTKPRVIPVRAKECDYFGTELGQIMSLPRGTGKFASGWYSSMRSGEDDRFLLLVAQEIESVFGIQED